MSRLVGRIRDEGGIAMVYAAILVGLVGLISIGLLQIVQGEDTRSRHDAVRNGSYQAAEAGVDAYLGKLLQNNAYSTQFMIAGESSRRIGSTTWTGSSTSDVDPTDASSWTYPNGKDVWTDKSKLGSGYQYNVEVCLPAQTCPAFGAGTSNYTRVLSTGRPVLAAGTPITPAVKSQWRSLEVWLRPKSISDYQMLSNASITYGSTATTYGDIYVVSDPNCGKSGYPSCNTLTHSGKSYGNLYADYQVSGGVQLLNGAKIYDKDSTPYTVRQMIPEPPSFTNFVSGIGDIQTAALPANGGLTLDLGGQYGAPPTGYEAWRLVFKSNGTVDVAKCKKTYSSSKYQNVWHVDPTCDPPVNYPLPTSGAIYSPQTILVEGVVAGKVTVCSGGTGNGASPPPLGNVVVSNNITYASEGTSVLGLVAKNDILVGGMAPSSLNWRAATLAQSGYFRSDPESSNGSKSVGTFTGSTATASGGAMSMFNTRNYLYDNTLRYLTPPLFPSMGSSYQVVVQREVAP